PARAGPASGSSPPASAASSASIAAGIGTRAATSRYGGALTAPTRSSPTRSSQHEPGAEVVAGIEDEPVLAGPVRGAVHLADHALRPLPGDPGGELLPTIESCRSTRPGISRPSANSSATRAQVPEPHGERSTSPSANTVTL